MNKVIIIGSGNNYNELGLVRNLGANGYRPYGILFCKENIWKHELVHRSKYWMKCDRVDTPDKAVELLIRKYANEKEKPIVITPVDYIVQILDSRFNELSENFIIQSFNNKANQINHYASKLEQYKLTKNMGFDMLDTYLIDLYSIDKAFFYSKLPLILKPVKGGEGRKDDITVCRTVEEFDNAIENFCNNKYLRVLCQSYLEDRKEILTYGAINKDKKLCSFVILENIRQWPNGYGVGCFAKTIDDKRIISFTENLYNTLMKQGYDGLIDLELFVDNSDGKIYVDEYNWRPGGRNFTSINFDTNFLVLWCLAKSNEDISSYGQVNNEMIYSINEIADFKHVKSNNISFFEYLSSFVKSKAYAAWNNKDIKPAIMLYLSQVRTIFK